MESENLIGQESFYYPLSFLGITHPLSAVNVDTIVNTWIVLAIIFFLIIIGRYLLFRPNSLAQFVIKELAKNFTELIEQSVGKFIDRYFLFITSIFIFILCCNWIGLVPYTEEPTKDLNTTLGLGIVAFMYMHKEMMQKHGIINYLKDIFMPMKIMFPFNLIAGIIMLPLKLLGELSTIISISFRLFGNIFGGFIISSMYFRTLSGSIILNLLGLGLGFNLLISAFFIIFEGFLQAFVFAILSLTNITMAIQSENIEDSQ